MFGADTPLVFEALQMAGIMVIASGGLVYFAMSRRKRTEPKVIAPQETPQAGRLEDRVRVLERIATDRSIDLASQIEALRTPDNSTPNATRLQSKEEQSQ